MSFSVKEITDPNDWQLLKEIRLKALQSDPGGFQRSYAEEAAKDEADWRDLIASLEAAVFILCEDETPIGMTGIGLSEEERAERLARLWGTWLEPRFRRKGLAAMLRQKALAWAHAHPRIDTVFLLQRGPDASERLAALGVEVKLTATGEKIWPDGTLALMHRYEIDVARERQPAF